MIDMRNYPSHHSVVHRLSRYTMRLAAFTSALVLLATPVVAAEGNIKGNISAKGGASSTFPAVGSTSRRRSTSAAASGGSAASKRPKPLAGGNRHNNGAKG